MSTSNSKTVVFRPGVHGSRSATSGHWPVRTVNAYVDMSTIYDTILWLESQATKKRFPIVQFSCDTDMVTAGWVSLTSIENPEIVVTQLTVEESRLTDKDSERDLQVERRVNKALNRSDLRCSWQVRADEVGPCAKGLSFQEFRKVYQPPNLFFRDILSEGALAEKVDCVTRAEFERSGGRLMVLQ